MEADVKKRKNSRQQAPAMLVQNNGVFINNAGGNVQEVESQRHMSSTWRFGLWASISAGTLILGGGRSPEER
jgi:hypothetical protein